MLSDAQECQDCSSTDMNSDSDIEVPLIVRKQENCSSTDINSDSDVDFIPSDRKNQIDRKGKRCTEIDRKGKRCTEETCSLEMDPTDLTINEDNTSCVHSECVNSAKIIEEKFQLSSTVRRSAYKVHNISDSSDEENIELPSLSERLACVRARVGGKKVQKKATFGGSACERYESSTVSKDFTGGLSKRTTLEQESEQIASRTYNQISSHNMEGIDLTEEEDENGIPIESLTVHKNISAFSKGIKYSSRVHVLSDSSDDENLTIPFHSDRLGGNMERKRFKKLHSAISGGMLSDCSSQGSMKIDSQYASFAELNTNNTDDLPELVDSVETSKSEPRIDKVEMKKRRRTPEEIAESKKKAQMLKTQKEKIRLEAKAKKDQEKKTKAQVREVERERKKQFGSYKDSLQYLKLVLDTHVVNNCGLGASVFKMCESLGCKCVTEDLVVPYSIRWRREVTDLQVTETGVETQRYEKTEDEAVLVLPVELFVELVDSFKQQQRNHSVDSDTLTEYVKKIQSYLPGTILTLVVTGIEKYFRDQKTAKQQRHRDAILAASNKETNSKKKGPKISVLVTRVDIEQAVTDTQLTTDTMVYMLETSDEVAEFLRTHSKAVADKPAKAGRLDSAAFSFQEEKVSGIRVDRYGNGLLKVWKQQIMQFKNVSPDVADAIAAVYPSPRLLIKAYSECTSQRSCERLLENIMVRRGAGVLETTRRVGKELSRRFCLFMNSTDPSLIIK